MPERLWTIVKWGLVVEMVCVILLGVNWYIERKVTGMLNQGFNEYHARYVQPLTQQRSQAALSAPPAPVVAPQAPPASRIPPQAPTK